MSLTLREFDDVLQEVAKLLVMLHVNKSIDPAQYEPARELVSAYDQFNEARDVFQFSEASCRLHEARQVIASVLDTAHETPADELVEVMREVDGTLKFVEEEVRRYEADKSWLIRSLHGGDGDYGVCSCSYDDRY